MISLSPKKTIRRVVLGLALVVLALLAAAVFLFVCTPWPAIWILRKPMSGTAGLTYPAGCENVLEQVQVLRDQPYPSEEGRSVYDLYLPKEARNAPLIVWVHGGAFIAGDKSGVENWGAMLASQGYAVAAVEYQIAPECRYPGQPRQVGECIRSLLARQDLPIDRQKVYLAGDSAGAHIAAQCALAMTNPDFAAATGLEPAMDPETLQGMVLCCGPYDVESFLDQEDPLIRFFVSRIGWAMLGTKNWKDNPLVPTLNVADWVTPDFPRSFITNGNTGSFESQGKELAAALEERGVEVSTLFFGPEEPTGHEYQYDLADPCGQRCWQAVLAFLGDNT